MENREVESAMDSVILTSISASLFALNAKVLLLTLLRDQICHTYQLLGIENFASDQGRSRHFRAEDRVTHRAHAGQALARILFEHPDQKINCL